MVRKQAGRTTLGSFTSKRHPLGPWYVNMNHCIAHSRKTRAGHPLIVSQRHCREDKLLGYSYSYFGYGYILYFCADQSCIILYVMTWAKRRSCTGKARSTGVGLSFHSRATPPRVDHALHVDMKCASLKKVNTIKIAQTTSDRGLCHVNGGGSQVRKRHGCKMQIYQC